MPSGNMRGAGAHKLGRASARLALGSHWTLRLQTFGIGICGEPASGAPPELREWAFKRRPLFIGDTVFVGSWKSSQRIASGGGKLPFLRRGLRLAEDRRHGFVRKGNARPARWPAGGSSPMNARHSGSERNGASLRTPNPLSLPKGRGPSTHRILPPSVVCVWQCARGEPPHPTTTPRAPVSKPRGAILMRNRIECLAAISGLADVAGLMAVPSIGAARAAGRADQIAKDCEPEVLVYEPSFGRRAAATFSTPDPPPFAAAIPYGDCRPAAHSTRICWKGIPASTQSTWMYEAIESARSIPGHDRVTPKVSAEPSCNSAAGPGRGYSGKGVRSDRRALIGDAVLTMLAAQDRG